MPWIVAFHALGDDFKPSQIDYPFTKSRDTGVIETEGRYRNVPAPFGLIDIEVPPHIPNSERIAFIVKIAQELLPELIRAGATEWEINIGRFYSAQCNEDLISEELALLASLQSPLCYSAYKVSQREERKLEKELGGYYEA